MLFTANYRAATNSNGNRVQVKRPDGTSKYYAWDYNYEGLSAYHHILKQAIEEYFDADWLKGLNVYITGTDGGAAAIVQYSQHPSIQFSGEHI